MALSLPPFLRRGPKYQAVMSLGPAQALTFPLRTEWLGPALVGSPGVRKAGAGESSSGIFSINHDCVGWKRQPPRQGASPHHSGRDMGQDHWPPRSPLG